MSCRLTAICFLLFLFRGQSVDLTHDFDLPEVDGSAVDTCMIFSVADTTTAATATTTTTTTPITRKQVVATTKKPNTVAPIKPQPAPAGPITNSHSNSAVSILRYLLTNSRGHAADPLQRFNGFISQPMGSYSTSDSDESAPTMFKSVGRTDTNTWKIGLFSSDDSSDES